MYLSAPLRLRNALNSSIPVPALKVMLSPVEMMYASLCALDESIATAAASIIIRFIAPPPAPGRDG